MEEENLDFVAIENAEKCDSITEFGESTPSVGGERDPSPEDKPDADATVEDVLENHVDERGLEFTAEGLTEMVEQSVVAEESGSEIIAAENEELPLEMEAEEEAKNGDEGVAAVSDTGDVPLHSESQVISGEDGLSVDPELKLKDEEEFAPEVDIKMEMVVTDSESKMGYREDEMLVDSLIGLEAEKESTPVVDPIMEGVVTDVDDAQEFSELQMDSKVDELHATMEGIEARDYKSERDMEDRENVEAVGEVDNQSVESRMVEANTATLVKGDEVDEQKFDFIINDSEVGAAEKSAGIEEEKVGFITEGMPIAEVRRDTETITEIHAVVADTSEHEQVNESTGVQEFVSCDVKYEHAEDREVAVEESLMSSNSELAESVDVEENEDDIVKEEPSAGNIKPETEEVVGLELRKKVLVEEIQFEGAEVVTEMESEVMAGQIPDEDGKTETEEQMGSEVMADQIPDDDRKTETKKQIASEVMADQIPDEDGKMETDEQMESEVMADQIPDEDGKMETEETSDVDETGQDIYDSPAAMQDEEDDAMVAEEDTGAQDTEETETDIAELEKTSGGKRKRNKSSKSTPVSKATAKASTRKTVGEDVCFICFDGGELVLCDRRGCPKAYHPSCVNRDEAFFKSKGRWNCGWHLCSICEKNARYMCYTCTFSLCKSCTKDAVILCVRGNKGFCETCMRTVMLIESNEQGNKDAQIDFDDKSSWEFLFKDYYIELKAKLSLSSDEIAEAKNPWKGGDMSGPSKQESSEAQADANDGGSGSDDSIAKLETVRPKRRKIRKQSKSRSKEEESVGTARDKTINLSDNSEWASKELLEFVSHMKDGDTSILSQFEVQALLLDYIKINKLRDPRRKSQIICDARFENLFGKPRVGHFEMLKLLESHFLVRDEHNDDFQGSVVDTENSQLDIDGSGDPLTKGVKDKKRKARRKGDSRGPQSNLDDYAAIDMHNIGLIYLRRKLMEDLLEDEETFHEKAVGTFVRIRISGSTQKQDMYRLVQVVGTSKAGEPYKVGKRTTYTMVEILNLDKTEIISIDTISNQEFTEEECKRLRQSIKCKLISPLTVGEILDKTTEIQAARVNDWLESEVLRLSHLRDRASDLGRRKELRECVEKLQLLKTPEERRRRLEETPKIHSDPKMDPSYESEDGSENEHSRRDAFMRSRGSGFSRRGRGPISPGSENSVKDSYSRASPGNNFSINASHIGEMAKEHSWNLERDREKQESYNSPKLNSPTNPESTEWAPRNVSRSESFSGVTSVTPQASLSSGTVETAAVKINESEKMWHYKDPSGKVQGPFSMVQLRKWNNTGYFPAELKIWRNTDKEDNSIFLADALVGKFPKQLPTVGNIISPADKLAGHSGKTSGTFLHQDKERSITKENWPVNDIRNLPSPTPTQRGHLITGAVQSPGVNEAVPSPIIGTHSSTPASVLSAIIETAAFSPTPNSQLGFSAVSRHSHSTTTNEPHEVPMQGNNHQTPQNVIITQNLQTDATTQGWGQPGQVQGYNWGTPSNVPNSSGSFPNSGSTVAMQQDMWRPTQASVPNMIPPTTPNASIGVRPENPNIGWGSTNTMQVNPNMGWVNPAPVNANTNWMPPAMQVPQPGGSFVAPPGNTGAANIQGWAPAQGWGGPPVQGGPVPGNGWVPPGGNVGPPPPPAVNQGWGGPQAGNQGSWGGEQTPSGGGGGQFMGQRGGGDSSFSGGRPWNRQSSFGGGGSRNKRETLCPFNLNGRCKKGSRCDFLHT